MNNTTLITRDTLLAIKAKLESEGKTLSPNSNLIRESKKTLTGLTPSQKESAIGHLLGDVRIEAGKSGKGHLLKFEWGNKNKDYALSVFEEFKAYILTPPREQKRINSLGNLNVTWCFQTILHPDFDCLGHLFLVNGKKILHDDLYSLITPRAIARWFMDDGGINGSHSHGIQFHTQGFTILEVNKLCSALNTLYKLDAVPIKEILLLTFQHVVIIAFYKFRRGIWWKA
jgi:hypothetical protein